MAKTGKKLKDVLSNLISYYGSVDYNRLSVADLKKDVTKRISESGLAPSENGILKDFNENLEKLSTREKILTHITETMFKLSGMSADIEDNAEDE